MRSTPTQRGIVLSVIFFTGCGGKVLVDQAQLGNEAGSGNASALPMACSGANEQPALGTNSGDDKLLAIPVLIRNDLTYSIFVGPQKDPCSEPLFEVRDTTGRAINPQALCVPSSESHSTVDAPGGSAIACPNSHAVMIEPGKSFSTLWAIPPGSLIFSAKAGSALQCLTTYCFCTPDATTGTCTSLPALVRGVPLTTQTTVLLNANDHDEVVTLAFDHGPQ
jgi:hypothetical protein